MKKAIVLLSLLPALTVLISAPAGAALNTSHISSDADLLQLLSDTLFVGEGRIGDGAGPATFEVDLGGSTGTPDTTAQYDWPNGVYVPFSLTYDHTTHEVVFTVDDVTLYWTSPLWVYTDVFVRARAVDDFTEMIVDDLVLDGEVVGDMSNAIGPDGLDILWINGGTLNNGFELTGRAKMTWVGTPPSQSNLAFQIKVGKLANVATDRTTWGRMKSLYR
jgi:hypothetical protein